MNNDVDNVNELLIYRADDISMLDVAVIYKLQRWHKVLLIPILKLMVGSYIIILSRCNQL